MLDTINLETKNLGSNFHVYFQVEGTMQFDILCNILMFIISMYISSLGDKMYCDVPGSPCLSKKGESSMWFVSF